MQQKFLLHNFVLRGRQIRPMIRRPERSHSEQALLITNFRVGKQLQHMLAAANANKSPPHTNTQSALPMR